ncbi:uncharacterized protein LOC114438104 isoform X2 [Parambassis ranga]|uniref:Uncharacterized protein LOC114438104 isoform X2 n=1 Tax=Parambassis ranga TaxID=210632 RepID=A0A6P7IP08_9TELE|nr:uncharacterized protein LOC114438104 isoform X2 [Parambassis ranga]
MCTRADSEEVIILSDDDDDNDDVDNDVDNERSCLIVEIEEEQETAYVLPPCAQDEDLVVTFSRRAKVLPHARYDCPVHSFTATEFETGCPVASNKLMCDQCYCYICDKLASSCAEWSKKEICHCNSHNKSTFWSNLRDNTLLGGLKHFNLTLSEVDSCLRRAEMLLQRFKKELSGLYASYQEGGKPQEYGLAQMNEQDRIYDYTPVCNCVSSFLNNADKQDNRAAAVMNLGAAGEFLGHCQVSENLILLSPVAYVNQAQTLLLQRVVASVQRLFVMSDFTPEFISKMQDFYYRLDFPPQLRIMKTSLCMRPWDDVLLVSVMKGQNVSGVRKDKGKKDVLIEKMAVVSLRVELLQRQQRYRELCRYLRVVQTDSRLFQQVQDLVPFFMCMAGDFRSALNSLFPSVNPPASRFTAGLFLIFLHIFKTATSPKMMVTQLSQLCYSDAVWEPIKDAVPLNCPELVKFAFRAQRYSSAVYTDSQCWTSLLTIVNAPSGPHSPLPAPSPQFLHEAQTVVYSILTDQQGSNVHLPHSFQEVYPEQALLLLVTGALGLRILNGDLSPVIPVINTFKENTWALSWMCQNLSSNQERMNSFFQSITQEVQKKNGSQLDVKLSFLQVEASQSAG